VNVAIYTKEDTRYSGYCSYGDGSGNGDSGIGGYGYTTYFDIYGKPVRYNLNHCYDDGSIYGHGDRSGIGLALRFEVQSE